MAATGRGTKRREQILEATLEVIATSGVDGVTHRAVATAAEVPLGAMTYYFAGRDDLLAQAFAHIAEREIDRVRDLAERLWPQPTIGEGIEIATDLVLDVLRDRSACVALCELHLAAARTPALQPIADRVATETERIVTHLLDEAGADEPAEAAVLVVAAFDGLGLRYLAQPDRPVEADRIRRLVARLLDGLSGSP